MTGANSPNLASVRIRAVKAGSAPTCVLKDAEKTSATSWLSDGWRPWPLRTRLASIPRASMFRAVLAAAVPSRLSSLIPAGQEVLNERTEANHSPPPPRRGPRVLPRDDRDRVGALHNRCREAMGSQLHQWARAAQYRRDGGEVQDRSLESGNETQLPQLARRRHYL